MTVIALQKHVESNLIRLGVDRDNWSKLANSALSKELRLLFRYRDGEIELPKGIYVCSYCNRKFDTCRGLNTHIGLVHKSDKELVECPVCGQICEKKIGLQYHLTRKHNMPRKREPYVYKSYFCDKCKITHRNNSKRGVKHLEYKAENSDEIVSKIMGDKAKKAKMLI